MTFPITRPRRLRGGEAIRRLVRETHLSPSQFIYPVFVSELVEDFAPIDAMPGIANHSPARAAEEARKAAELGIPAVLLFGTPAEKDPTGSASTRRDGVIQKAIREIKSRDVDILVVTDVCLCEYTDHGHCGVVKDGKVDNDASLELLAAQALSHAEAGADMVAPSDMMDGRVAAIRAALDDRGFTGIPIMSYAAKYCSAFYGPFREAVDSAPRFGDRKSYQMDPANATEAIKEISLDIEEGADIIMVKPALAYLDVISRAREHFAVPLAAYNVSGEYTMVKLISKAQIARERPLTLEILTAIRRAGADVIITYHALEAARWLADGGEE
jgi:porphobilinogen synthase